MLSTDLLTENYRYKWLILQYIEMNKNSYCTTIQISELFEISQYKTENYIKDLHEELQQLDPKVGIEIGGSEEVCPRNLSHLLLKKLRVRYLKESDLFNILHLFLVEELSLKQQMERLHLSKSAIYIHNNDLKGILADENIQLKRNKLVGDELDLRSVLFSTYYELFNGVEDPFPTEIQQLTGKILKRLTETFRLTHSKTRSLKLELFINIWLVRLRHGHFSSSSYVSHQENDFSLWLRDLIAGTYTVPVADLDHEIAYLILYLHFELGTGEFVCAFHTNEVEQRAVAITDHFMEQFHREFDRQLQDFSGFSRIYDELTDINRKWLIYHFRDQSFVIKGEFTYFQEINPRLDRLIKEFIFSLEGTGYFQSNAERNKLYYDYLFLLIAKLPMELVEEPLYICIDFSHGQNYNHYIRSMLGSLQTMNICYEHKVSAKTDLFLSDCAMDKLICPQLIWKKPPTANDWRELGELLVQMKEGEQ